MQDKKEVRFFRNDIFYIPAVGFLAYRIYSVISNKKTLLGFLFFMNFLEKDLETIICENPKECLNRGLFDMEHHGLLRQVNLGSYGILDMLGITVVGKLHGRWRVRFTIYELKKEHVDASALMQAYRYRKGIIRCIQEGLKSKLFMDFKIALIGKEIQKSGDFVFLLDGNKDVSAYTYSYAVDGIKFNCHDDANWTMNKEDFPSKDYSDMINWVMKRYVQEKEPTYKILPF